MKQLKLNTFQEPRGALPNKVKTAIWCGKVEKAYKPNNWFYKGYYYYSAIKDKFYKVINVELEKMPNGNYKTKNVVVVWEDGQISMHASAYLDLKKDLILDVNGFWF